MGETYLNSLIHDAFRCELFEDWLSDRECLDAALSGALVVQNVGEAESSKSFSFDFFDRWLSMNLLGDE